VYHNTVQQRNPEEIDADTVSRWRIDQTSFFSSLAGPAKASA
jgi:hypothetical protein